MYVTEKMLEIFSGKHVNSKQNWTSSWVIFVNSFYSMCTSGKYHKSKNLKEVKYMGLLLFVLLPCWYVSFIYHLSIHLIHMYLASIIPVNRSWYCSHTFLMGVILITKCMSLESKLVLWRDALSQKIQEEKCHHLLENMNVAAWGVSSPAVAKARRDASC